MSSNDTLEGIGVHHMWGFSQAFNLQESYAVNHDAYRRSKATRKSNVDAKPSSTNSAPSTDSGEVRPLSILLSNPADIRHVVKTLSQRRRHERRPLHFYVMERPIEVLARHILLLAAATDWEIPIRHRANAFLELFGNTLVQRRTAKYIAVKGKELENLLCDGVGSETMRSLIDFSLLKHRERDELQRVFKSWDTSIPFNAQELLDRRLRLLYKDRYDFRKNVIDWDYQWALKPIGSIVHIRQFRQWRQTGVAFEFGDQQYALPNRSMSSYAEGRERGRSMMRRGLWTDIVCSPFISLGIDSDTPNEHAEEIFDIYNQDTGSEQHRHHAVEVAVHNIVSALYEIETGNVYRMARAHDIYSGLGEKRSKKKKKTREQIEKEVEEAKRKLAEVEALQRQAAEAVTEEDVAVDMEFDATTEKFTKVQIEADSDDDPDEDESNSDKSNSKEESQEKKSEELEQMKAAAIAQVNSAEAAHSAFVEEEESEEERAKAREKAIRRAQNIMEILSDVKIFVMGQKVEDLLERPKKRFANLFDCAFLANKSAHLLRDKRIKNLFSEGAIINVETTKFVLPLEKDNKQRFVDNLAVIAKDLGCKAAPVQPKFWNRAWSKKSAAERRERKKEKEKEKKNKDKDKEEDEDKDKKIESTNSPSDKGESKKSEEVKSDQDSTKGKANKKVDLDAIPSVMTFILP